MQSLGSWSFSLIRDMKQTSNHIIRSDLAVVMRDKYPKSRHHFLVLPWADIDTVYQLTRRDIPLLEEMHLLGTNAIELSRGRREDFKVGFHMKPSMHRLHLHVLSKDFVSDRLKHKLHWNSFNTDFFMPFESEVIAFPEKLLRSLTLFLLLGRHSSSTGRTRSSRTTSGAIHRKSTENAAGMPPMRPETPDHARSEEAPGGPSSITLIKRSVISTKLGITRGDPGYCALCG